MKLKIDKSDLEGLPDKLLSQLKSTQSKALCKVTAEAIIIEIIKNNGGAASMEQILIGYYRKKKKVLKRQSMYSRVYKMKTDGLLKSTGIRGVYALPDFDISELNQDR